MDKFTSVKYLNKEFSSVSTFGASVGAAISAAFQFFHEGAEMNHIISCANENPWCLLGEIFLVFIGGTAATILVFYFFAFLADLIRISIVDIFPNIVNIAKTPNAKNLQVSSGKLHGDIFTLNFKNTEWRYRSASCYIHAGISQTLGFLNWRENKDFRPFPVVRNKNYEVDFIRIDKENNRIRIATNTEQQYFGIGNYTFRVMFSARYAVKRNNPIDIHREVYALIIYKGGNDVSVKIAYSIEKAKKLAYAEEYK